RAPRLGSDPGLAAWATAPPDGAPLRRAIGGACGPAGAAMSYGHVPRPVRRAREGHGGRRRCGVALRRRLAAREDAVDLVRQRARPVDEGGRLAARELEQRPVGAQARELEVGEAGLPR